MPSKSAKAVVGSAHTSGIYADMTVDGPIIGTLVVVIDKARHLPNRKSMGKQDPYCAARLGKEAKKTETDKRGGQTPKWDQELRFTVHDSPDYHRLKVSVFNDDKKTDLIGETWVDLEPVLTPGGGQNDLWHSLHCKGRYSGEIRIELTYYDTRPRDDVVVERRANERVGYEVESRESLGGPRQLKQVKRRPLPQDPTAMTRHRGHPSINTEPSSSYITGPRGYDYPTEYRPDLATRPRGESLPAANVLHSHSRYAHASNYPPPVQKYPQYRDSPPKGLESRMHQPEPSGPPPSQPDGYGAEEYGDSMEPVQGYAPDWSQSAPISHEHRQSLPLEHHRYSAAITPPTSQAEQSRGFTSHSHGHYPEPGPPEPRSAPNVNQHQATNDFYSSRQEIAQHSYESLPPQEDQYQENPPIYSTHSGSYSRQDLCQPIARTHEAPPPPPAHRSTVQAQTYVSPTAEPYEPEPPVQAPSPLTQDDSMGLVPMNHYSTSQSDVSGSLRERSSTISSPTDYASTSAPSVSTHTSYSHQDQWENQDDDRRHSGQLIPVSLVAGYDPRIAEEEAARMAHEKRMSARFSTHPDIVPSYQDPRYENQPHNYQPQAPVPRYSASPRSMEEPRDYRSSTAMVDPRAVSPVPTITPERNPIDRATHRKSISPAPRPAPQQGERRLSGIPFSPDSYDELNPNVGSGTMFQSQNRPYESPAGPEPVHDDGPIIGNDGRVIDPSDHLPTETWAPEPERKSPQKKPEFVIRSRPSPQGAQPMPPSGRRPPRDSNSRPHSMVITPMYAHSHSPTAQMPTSTSMVTPTVRMSRNRLQKPNRNSAPPVQPLQPASNPNLPTLNNMARTPPQSLQRASVSEYPLREHGNYGYDASPSYGRDGVRSGPPIPEKVPMDMGMQNSGDMSALSMEMQRIDIGNSGRVRRIRFGPS
ncbi:MAG: hypothetical protein M1834_007935 [Cirrosporium novae-zelandiae]|nr:MAG: hypothetical protein M1834_007935 [Cirrosporium novae-zelandiae]